MPDFSGQTASLTFSATGDFFRFVRDENNNKISDQINDPIEAEGAPFITITGKTAAQT